jgi:hypothetical protein
VKSAALLADEEIAARRADRSAMKMLLRILSLTAAVASIAILAPAQADDMMHMAMPKVMTMSQTAGPYRIELDVLPAEPFYTKPDVAKDHVAKGMLVVGGAAPVPPDAASHPNHHLVFHVFDAATGKALTGQHVTMTYAKVMTDGKMGAPVSVPIVEMQAIGMGAKSTHYGNNVTLAPGIYHVTIAVGPTAKTDFTLQLKG